MALKTKNEGELNRLSYDRDRDKKSTPSLAGDTTQRSTTPESSYAAVQQKSVEEEAKYALTDVNVIKDLGFAETTGTVLYEKVFDSIIDLRLQDIIFVNSHSSQTTSFSVLLSEFDISEDPITKFPNQELELDKSTVFLLHDFDLRASTSLVSDQATSNQISLRQAAFLGDTNISSKKKQIFIYVSKAEANGTIDVTIFK